MAIEVADLSKTTFRTTRAADDICSEGILTGRSGWWRNASVRSHRSRLSAVRCGSQKATMLHSNIQFGFLWWLTKRIEDAWVSSLRHQFIEVARRAEHLNRPLHSRTHGVSQPYCT